MYRCVDHEVGDSLPCLAAHYRANQNDLNFLNHLNHLNESQNHFVKSGYFVPVICTAKMAKLLSNYQNEGVCRPYTVLLKCVWK